MCRSRWTSTPKMSPRRFWAWPMCRLQNAHPVSVISGVRARLSHLKVKNWRMGIGVSMDIRLKTMSVITVNSMAKAIRTIPRCDGHGGMRMPPFHHGIGGHGLEDFDFNSLSEKDLEIVQEMFHFLFPDVELEGESDGKGGL